MKTMEEMTPTTSHEPTLDNPDCTVAVTKADDILEIKVFNTKKLVKKKTLFKDIEGFWVRLGSKDEIWFTINRP